MLQVGDRDRPRAGNAVCGGENHTLPDDETRRVTVRTGLGGSAQIGADLDDPVASRPCR